MAKFTVVGDPHAKPDNLDKINTLFDIIEELGNDTIILGDLLDTKELVRGKCLNAYFNRLSKSKLQFYILVGNHDWFNLECQDHSLKPLSVLENVTIIDTPQIVKLGTKPCYFHPYTHDTEVFKRTLKGLTPKTIFCHADIKGFDYGNGIFSKDGLDFEDLDKHNVISGHYHKYQKKGNITYLGTPFSHSFGESNQDKFLGIFDSDTNELDLIETPFPKHVTMEVDADTAPEWDNYTSDNYVRIILTGKPENIKLFKRAPGVKYIEAPTKTRNIQVINETQSPEIQFSKWAKEIKGYDDDLIKLGLEILRDV